MMNGDALATIRNSLFEWTSLNQTDLKSLRKHLATLDGEQIESFQAAVVSQTVNSDIWRRFPPRLESVHEALKRLTLLFEEFGEVHPDLYAALLSSSKTANATKNEAVDKYKSYFVQDQYLVSLKELPFISETTGLRTWFASKALSQYLYERRDSLLSQCGGNSNVTCLELGAGTGFLGISLTKFLDNMNFILTDHHPKVLATLKSNIEMNLDRDQWSEESTATTTSPPPSSPSSDIDAAVVLTTFRNRSTHKTLAVAALDWFDADAATRRFASRADLVVAADVAYDVDSIPMLVNVLALLRPALAVLANVRRTESAAVLFESLLAQRLSATHAIVVDDHAAFSLADQAPLRIVALRRI